MQCGNPRQYLEVICVICPGCGAQPIEPCRIAGCRRAGEERLVCMSRWQRAKVGALTCFERMDQTKGSGPQGRRAVARCRLLEDMGYSRLDLARLDRSGKPPARNPIPGKRLPTLPPDQ